MLCGAGLVADKVIGDLPGFQSMAVWLPGRQQAIVVLSNEETTDTAAAVRRLMAD